MPVGLFLDVMQSEFIPRSNQLPTAQETATFYIQQRRMNIYLDCL